MFMSGIEKNGFDKGKEIGLKEGEVIGIKKGEKKMFNNLVQSLIEIGSTKEQATEQALKLLRLNTIPEDIKTN